jgi:hypothetical protein
MVARYVEHLYMVLYYPVCNIFNIDLEHPVALLLYLKNAVRFFVAQALAYRERRARARKVRRDD